MNERHSVLKVLFNHIVKFWRKIPTTARNLPYWGDSAHWNQVNCNLNPKVHACSWAAAHPMFEYEHDGYISSIHNSNPGYSTWLHILMSIELPLLAFFYRILNRSKPPSLNHCIIQSNKPNTSWSHLKSGNSHNYNILPFSNITPFIHPISPSKPSQSVPCPPHQSWKSRPFLTHSTKQTHSISQFPNLPTQGIHLSRIIPFTLKQSSYKGAYLN